MAGYRDILCILLFICIIHSVGGTTAVFCTDGEVSLNDFNSKHELRSPNYDSRPYYNISKDCEISAHVNITQPYVVHVVQAAANDCTERFCVLDASKNTFTDQTTNCTRLETRSIRAVDTYFRSGGDQNLLVQLPAGYAVRVGLSVSVTPIEAGLSTKWTRTTSTNTPRTTTTSKSTPRTATTSTTTPRTTTTSATTHSTTTSQINVTSPATAMIATANETTEADTPTSPLPAECEEKLQQREYLAAGVGVAGFIAGVSVTLFTTVVLLRTRYIISKRNGESNEPADVDSPTLYDVVAESSRTGGQAQTVATYDEAAVETTAHRYSYVDLPERDNSVSANEYMSLNTTFVLSSTEGPAMIETHLYEKLPQAKSSDK